VQARQLSFVVLIYTSYELDRECYKWQTGEIFNLTSRVEAGQNTSTVALRVVRGDKKGTQCPGVYLDHPVPGGYKYGTWPSRLGKSQELGQ
jgi:hypothetical protein